MDKNARIILGFAIGILFPILIYFTAITVIPNGKTPQYPIEPSTPICNVSRYDSYSGADVEYNQCNYNRSYQDKKQAYEEELKNYNDTVAKNEKRHVYQAEAVLVISIIGIVCAVAFRQARELLGGLTGGSALSIIVAVTIIAAYMSDNHPEKVLTLMVTIGFVILTVILWIVEKVIQPSAGAVPANHPEKSGATPAPPPPAPKLPTPPNANVS
ncbi:MAG TPA: hypothetical protein VJC09_01345 [Candidatus Saccharimonadales bacterium]|nr:hypothetical protein [Candidatus Saccharimonadales bacterium]